MCANFYPDYECEENLNQFKKRFRTCLTSANVASVVLFKSEMFVFCYCCCYVFVVVVVAVVAVIVCVVVCVVIVIVVIVVVI